MKRDMDLIRKVLMTVEEQPLDYGGLELSIDGYDRETIAEHVRMLAKSGYIEATDVSTMDRGTDWRPKRLTWQGHDFLEAARNDTIWSKAKAKITELGVGFSMEITKATLISIAKEKLNLG
jgi:DNA-binding HxlR family transcriptional regulator